MIIYKREKISDLKIHDYTDKVIHEGIVYENCDFLIPLSFIFARIEGRVCFEKCNFSEDVVFGDLERLTCACRLQNLEFRNCFFNKKLLLDGITCDNSIIIDACRFNFDIDNEFGLSARTAHIDNSFVVKNGDIRYSISLERTTINLVRCLFENDQIDCPDGSLVFSSCQSNKQFSFRE